MFESGRCKIRRAASQREYLHRKRTLQWSKGSCTNSRRVEEFLLFTEFSYLLHIHFIFEAYIYAGSTVCVPMIVVD